MAYTGLDSAAGTITFTGPSASVATLTLTAEADSTPDAGETVIIGLGTLDDTSGTDLSGGAARHRHRRQ